MLEPSFGPSPTIEWIARAADDPAARHPKRLPERLDFSEHSALFLHVLHAAPPGTEPGFPLLLQGGRLTFPPTLASRARYDAYQAEGRFVGTFHVHPEDRAPFFDPQDLAASLRSDSPGFVDLLLARGRLYALVRANPFLYISGHHVNRNPLLLAETHAGLLRRAGGDAPESAGPAYRKASLYFFHRYQLALYEGDPSEPLVRTVTPEASW